MRIEVYYKRPEMDGRARRVLSMLSEMSDGTFEGVGIVDVYLFERLPALTTPQARSVFADPVAQECSAGPAVDSGVFGEAWVYLIEVVYRAGVHDPVGATAREAAALALGVSHSDRALENAVIQTARQYLLFGESIGAGHAEAAAAVLHNPLIERATILSRNEWRSGLRFPASYPHTVAPSTVEAQHFDIATMDQKAMNELSRTRLLALSAEEMEAVRSYYRRTEVQEDRAAHGLSRRATDVELEMLAQTWSEHCKHKILNADIDYTDSTTGESETVRSVFKTYVRGTTEKLADTKTYLRSVFHDDSGVVAFDDETLICFKVETHNSPSALDPYGGAITGIVGVNRDILGTGKGARPIFNTNVLCFADPRTPSSDVPPGLLHPKAIMRGVHHGIIDGGNQSGIPVVAGAFLFDESYVGKPLVFCGTGGILPAEIHGEAAWIKHIDPGDQAVMVGGRIGKDGIHGATFSSLALDESSPTSAVQIGDPITQKRMSDFLIEARDLGLYKGITDNGAGGLSSSLGEMAEGSGGVRIELDRCPLKYSGLAPWEILLSESQERMSLAVDPAKIDAFLALARRRDVEATVVGEFTDSGFVEMLHDGVVVGRLELEFLHNGLPTMRLEAVWSPPMRPCTGGVSAAEHPEPTAETMLAVLADPVVASKEALVRQYDHEVQAQSVVKPFVGPMADGPSDGAVLRPRLDSRRGVTVTHGVCPRYGDVDTYHMAMCAVDEAYRAHISLGGNPDLVSALDNFCWPDPVQSEHTPDGRYKLAQLVRAGKGLQDACLAYGIPLISGKDSMKNDAQVGGRKVSVRPTLLVSLMGVIDDIGLSVTTDFRRSDDRILLVGRTRDELAGTVYERLRGASFADCPTVRTGAAMAAYQAVHACIGEGLVVSCHDLSDGGLAAAVLECAVGGRLGADIDLRLVRTEGPLSTESVLFSESPSRLLLTVSPENLSRVLSLLPPNDVTEIGTVTEGGNRAEVTVRTGEAPLRVGLSDAIGAWTRAFGNPEDPEAAR